MVAPSHLCHPACNIEEAPPNSRERGPHPEQQRFEKCGQVPSALSATLLPRFRGVKGKSFVWSRMCKARTRSRQQQSSSEPVRVNVLCASSRGGSVSRISQVSWCVDLEKEMEHLSNPIFANEVIKFHIGETTS